ETPLKELRERAFQDGDDAARHEVPESRPPKEGRGPDQQTRASTRLPDTLDLGIRITDPDVVAELVAHSAGTAREEFARSALRIGVVAIRQAEGEIDAAVVRRESDRLLGELARTLDAHQQTVTLQLTGALQEYFHPESGRFHERIERLIRQDGELEQVL